MNQNVRGLLAYLFGWVGGLIVLFAFKDNDSKTKFNACQAIVLGAIGTIAGLVLGFIPIIKYAGYIIQVLMIVARIVGMIKAYNEEDFEIPTISDLTRKIFAKQLD